MTDIRDYNGQGRWSGEAIESRFKSYARTFGTTITDLSPQTYQKGDVTWIYPSADAVIEGIKKRDPACVEIGIELIEESASMPFGMILKSNTARALRQVDDMLTESQRSRIRNRVADMLVAGYMPREFVQYVKLARKIGMGAVLSRIQAEADLEIPWVRRYFERLMSK